MLWMGEEWSASAPFLFFVDFAPDDELNKAVREGRRREFKSFAAFADDTSIIPDPTEEKTFRDSKIDWAERRPARPPRGLADTRNLLQIRRQCGGAADEVPLSRRHGRHAASRRHRLHLDATRAARCASSPISAAEEFETQADGGHIIWSSETGETEVRLPSWTGIVLTKAA